MTNALPHARDIRLVRELGRGGHGTVFEADQAGERVALKRLRPGLTDQPGALARFEREYHTLAQLAHPNIVDVYGYGIDADGPYYTMELLDQGSLRDRLPLAADAACRILRDVAAALAMVHSRRFVHRDVSLSNVRLSADGRAKLIDFGAMTQIGVPADTIGTPAFMAPEAVHRQALDPRTDLFSLGALGYRLLTGSDAYPARRIDQLRDAWRSRPRALADRIAFVPAALDELLRQLLSLHPEGRPRTAAEVFARLSAVLGEEVVDEAEIAQAYLIAPNLVGRNAPLSVIRRSLLRAKRSDSGEVLLVEGPAGVGRSRLLDACLLDGRLTGAVVLHVRGVSNGGPLSVLTAAAQELAKAHPDTAGLSQAVRALIAGDLCDDDPATDIQAALTTLQADVIQWFRHLSTRRSLLLVIDDMHLVDAESAAILVRLATRAATGAMVVVASARAEVGDEPSQPALRLLRESAITLRLDNVSEATAEQLVRSLFGDVENVHVAARRIFEIAQGHPRATVELASWLVDQGHVSHEGGRWLIPDTLSDLPLPKSMNEALRERVAALGEDARTLATALALSGDVPLEVGHFAALLGAPAGTEADLSAAHSTSHGARLHAALAELTARGVLVERGSFHEFAQTAYGPLLRADCEASTRALLHERLAAILAAAGHDDWHIYHLCHGHDPNAGVERLLSRLRAGDPPTGVLVTLDARVAWLRDALAVCVRCDRPAADRFVIEHAMVAQAEVKVSLVREQIASLSAQYRDLTGHDDYFALPDDMSEDERITRALQAALARHDARPERERVLDPVEALRSLVAFVSTCLSGAAANSELSLVESLPSLVPFASLSDAVRLMCIYAEAVKATIGGRADLASELFIEVLSELDGPVGAGMGETAQRMRRHAVIAIGMLNAGMSRSIALDYAAQLDVLAEGHRDRYARTTSLRIRHTYHLRRGNWSQAEYWRNEVEVDKLENRSAVFNPSGVFALSFIHAMADSVVGMRDCLTQMRDYSETSPGLQVWEQYMTAEYDRARGAPEVALSGFMDILSGQAGRHMAWLYSAHGALLCLASLERFAEGRALGDRLLAQASEAQLSLARGLILRPLSLIEAHLGHFDKAVAYLDENIQHSHLSGLGGINLGAAYEFRARVALLQRDRAAFEHFSERCTEQYHADGINPDLTARVDALLDRARELGLVDPSWQPRRVAALTLPTELVELRDRLMDCGPGECFAKGLAAVVTAMGARGGYLLGVAPDGLELLAAEQHRSIPADLMEVGRRVLSRALHGPDAIIAEEGLTDTDAEATFTGSAQAFEFATDWTEPLVEGLIPHMLLPSRQPTPVAIALIDPGSRTPVPIERALLEVIADAIAHSRDRRAA